MKKNYSKKVIFVISITILILTILAIVAILLILLNLNFQNIYKLNSFSIIPFMLIGIVVGILGAILETYKNKNSTEEVSEYSKILRESLLSKKISENIDSKNPIENNPTDILELMSINMTEIKEYYVLSKTMAKKSYNLSIFVITINISLFLSRYNIGFN